MESLPKKIRNQISNVRKSGVQISRCEVFIFAGLLTNTYILLPIVFELFRKDTQTDFQILTNQQLNYLIR